MDVDIYHKTTSIEIFTFGIFTSRGGTPIDGSMSVNAGQPLRVFSTTSQSCQKLLDVGFHLIISFFSESVVPYIPSRAW